MNNKNPPHDYSGLWKYECSTGMTYEKKFVAGVESSIYRHLLKYEVVLREGYKQDGLDHGFVTIRNANGKVLARYEFEHGTGTHLIYTLSETTGWEIPYRAGLIHGAKRHYIKGKVASEENYFNSKII